MPNKYNTGGSIPGKSGTHLPGTGPVAAIDVAEANDGTTYNQPNAGAASDAPGTWEAKAKK